MAAQIVYKRNVVILGKTGSGKSTVANKILGSPNEFEVVSSLESATKGTQLAQARLTFPANNACGVQFDLKIIDTRGLFDTQGKLKIGEELQDIRKFLEREVPEGINLVLFVHSQERFTPQERETFDCMIKHFQSFSDFSGLVITRREGEDEECRRRIIEEFKESKVTKEIARFMKRGIIVVGFPDTTRFKQELKKVFEEGMQVDEQKLKQLVFTCEDIPLTMVHEQGFWEKVKDKCTIL